MSDDGQKEETVVGQEVGEIKDKEEMFEETDKKEAVVEKTFHEPTEDFETADAGASLDFPMQCSALRKNGHVLIKSRPCKIIEMSTSKTGKHGHAKVHLVGIDIFTGKKLEDISPSTHNMSVPYVQRTEYQLVNIDQDYLSLITPDGHTKDDVKCPEGDIGSDIQKGFDEGKDLIVTVVSAMDEEQAISFKIAPKADD